MPAISRQVGTVSSLINVFIPDATVSTGAGLANIVASTVVLAWHRSDMSAVSSTTLTTGTLGTWASSTMTQLGSTSTLGWYQVSLPHGVFVSGDNATVHLAGAPSMAPVPILIELTKTDNQTYLSSQTVGFVRNNVSVSAVTIPIGISTGVVSVSAATIPFGVSSISTPVTASTAGVTSISIPVSASSVTAAVNVSSIYGSAAVTSAAGVFQPGVVSSFTAGALGQFFTTDAGDYSTSVLGSIVQEIADNVSATVGAQVGVSSISIPVTVSNMTVNALTRFFDTGVVLYSTAVVSSVVREIASNATATVGLVGVSSITIPVGVSTGSVRVTSITIPVGVSTGTVGVSSYSNESGIIHKGTAQGGTSTTIILEATLSTYANDIPNGSAVYIASGVGAGQTRNVDDWISSTMTAQVSPFWTTNPTSTSVYQWFAAPPASTGSTPSVTLVSTTILVGASTVTTPVTASSVTAGVNVTTVAIPVGVSTGSVRVTSISIPVGVSSISTPVTASTAGVTSISIPVSVSSGTVRVSAATIPFGVSSLTAAALGNFFDVPTGLFFSTAVVSSVAYEIATNAAGGGLVGVSSISVPVGVSSIATPVTASSVTRLVGASTVTIPVGVSTGSIEVSSATAGVNEAVADALLGRNVAGGSNTGRVVKEAFYAIRNKVDLNAGIVYQTDDTTSSWAFSVSTVAGDPVQVIDPA